MAAEFINAIRKDGQDYSNIRGFQNQPGIGFGCNCFCPECGKKVGARIFVDSPESSCFFHEADEMNVNCNGGAGETQEHIFAKRIFELHSELYLPNPSGKGELVTFQYVDVKFEKKQDSFRPDIILTAQSGERLIVENTVTHKTFTSPIKMRKLQESGIAAIELTIDRNLIPKSNSKSVITFLEFVKIFDQHIIYQIANKRWLVNPINFSLKEKIKNPENNKNGLWIFAFFLIVFLIFANNSKARKFKNSKRKPRPLAKQGSLPKYFNY